MAERHDLNITISEEGEIELKVEGVSGPKCLKITEILEEDLGEVLSREKTSEFYKNENEINTDINLNSNK